MPCYLLEDLVHPFYVQTPMDLMLVTKDAPRMRARAIQINVFYPATPGILIPSTNRAQRISIEIPIIRKKVIKGTSYTVGDAYLGLA